MVGDMPASSQRRLDINSDVGERSGPAGLAADVELLEIVSSANVACGGHAGDDVSMRELCTIAAERHISIGAQVSFVDREAFGRRHLDVPPGVLTTQVNEQWQALAEAAAHAGTAVEYVRPHGALYNAALTDLSVAEAILAGVPEGTPVLCLAGSALAQSARVRGMPVVTEVFADRAVTDAGTLVSRGQAGAVIVDPVHVVARLRTWLATGMIRTISGQVIEFPADSICVHSDTPGSLELARLLRSALERDGAAIEPLTRFNPPAQT